MCLFCGCLKIATQLAPGVIENASRRLLVVYKCDCKKRVIHNMSYSRACDIRPVFQKHQCPLALFLYDSMRAAGVEQTHRMYTEKNFRENYDVDVRFFVRFGTLCLCGLLVDN